MKYKLHILLAILLPIVSGCTERLLQQNSSIPASQPTNIRSTFDQPIYCPTRDEKAELFFNIGLTLTKKGNLEAATRAYRDAIKIDPLFCDAMDNLGVVLRRLGQLDEAISWYKRSAEISPSNPTPHQNLAIVYGLQGKLDEALSEHQMVIKIDSDNPEGYYGLGTDYLKLNEFQLALENLQIAEQLYAKRSSPLITDARHALGITYYNLKDLEKARYYFEQIYDQMQNDPGVNYALGLCYLFEVKDPNEARKYLKRAQELGAKIPGELVQKLNL